MKKYISIFIISIIVIMVIVLLVFRHEIIGHALKVSINKKTDQTISLNIGDIYYDILNSTVSFTDSEFLFNNTFLNQNKTIELSQLKFDKIKINNLSIYKLIFKREVIAKKITIKKPSLWFMENNNPKPFKEKPEEIIKSLKQHHDIFKDLIVIVGEIEITHGKVDLKSLIKGKEHNGSVEFKLLLKEINTSNKQNFNKDKILFAEEHFVKLSNFNYTLPVGDIIDFDSVVFDSKSSSLITSNLRITIKGATKNSKIRSVTTQIRELLIAGINFEAIEDLHNIDIDNIAISDADITLTNNNSNKPVIISDTIVHKRNLFSLFHRINLGSLVLKNINLLNNEFEGDTIINLDNLNFSVNNILIDSSSMVNKIPDIDYNSISISSGKLKIIEKKAGLKLKLEKLNFDEKNGVVSFEGIQIREHNTKGSASFTTNIAAIDIYGVSLQNISNGKKMKIALDIVHPIIDFEIIRKSNENSKKKKLNLGNIEITEIKISNGNIHLFEKNKLDVSIDEFDFNSGIVQITDFSNIHEIKTDDFLISTSSIKVNLLEKGILLSTNSISILNNAFKINDISTHIKESNKVDASIYVSQLAFGGFNIKEIVNDKKINIEKFKIVNPIINGSLSFSGGSNIHLKNNPKQHLDYMLNINDFEIIKGNIDLGLNIKNDNLEVKTGIDIAINNIYFENSSDTTWLNKLVWKIDLSNPVINYQDYLVNCNYIKLDNEKELMILQDIEIYDNLNSKLKSGIDIHNLAIKSINLTGVKYNTIIEKQIPVVNSISIQTPFFDISIVSSNKKTNGAKGQLNKTYLPFDINIFEINNLSLKIKKTDSVSTSNINLSDLDFKYDMSVKNNFLDGLSYFNATSFVFYDTIKNSFASIKSINSSQNGKEINISDIEGGNIKKQEPIDNYIHYALSELVIENLNITQTFPLDIIIEGIDIGDFNLNIENHKKTSTRKKIALPNLINTLRIDEIVGSNIDFTHIALSDTSNNKLELNDISFLISSINVDSSSFDDNNFAFIEKVSVRLEENKFVSKDSLYVTSINNIAYDFNKNELIIDTLLTKPRYKPSVFFKKAIYQTGMMNINVSKVVCSNIRLKKLLNDGNIHMGGVDTYGLDMHIFRNKVYEMDPNLYKKMPQEALLSIPQIITIDSLKTHNAYILYRQLSKKSIIPGEIFLDNVDLSVFNINNDLSVIDKTSSMVIFFNAMLLGEAKTSLKMTLPILSPSNDFWVSGHVDKIDFTKLNSMTQNLVGITLKKGTGEVDIPLISGNSVHSQGTIAFKYRKLKIELYDRDKAQNAKGLGGNMANLLLNDILIKSNNPGFLGKTRTGEVYFKRNTQKSIVAYTWKSILSGIMSTMGYNNKEQRQEKKTIRRNNR